MINLHSTWGRLKNLRADLKIGYVMLLLLPLVFWLSAYLVERSIAVSVLIAYVIGMYSFLKTPNKDPKMTKEEEKEASDLYDQIIEANQKGIDSKELTHKLATILVKIKNR